MPFLGKGKKADLIKLAIELGEYPQTLPQTKIELKKLLPTFNPEVDNMDLFLTLFERQMKLLDLGEDLWVTYLIGALPSDVTSLIAPEPEEKNAGITPTFEEYFCNGSN
ncbi:uncharacterized protein TNCV_485361 [Trichonephila clavipes]|nr:uncharacterized protein TNCV_485361 [Trichonephila clavipes]